MMADLMVIGAGYTGLRLVERALKMGWRVSATSRSDDSLTKLEGLGARALRFDVLSQDPDVLEDALTPGMHLVYSVPTLFRTLEPERHIAPLAGILDVAVKRSVGRVVYLSSTSVYGDHQGAWVDESSACAPMSALGKMRLDLERHVLGRAGAFDAAYVARVVGIYGPGRTLADYLRRGRYAVVDGGKKVTNRVHVEDIVTSVLAMLERGAPGPRIYNISDGSPQPVHALVSMLTSRLEVGEVRRETLEAYEARVGPNAAARWKTSYRCSNARLLSELGVQLAYPDALEGYAAMIDAGEIE